MKVAIHALPSQQVVARVARREADFGLAFAPFSDPAVKAEVLAVSDIACIMLASHKLAARDEITIEELAGARHHHLRAADRDRHAGRAGVSRCRIALSRRIQVNYSTTAFILAARGAGIALVEPLLLRATPMPSLVVRPLRPRIEVRTMLVHALGRPMTKTGDRLVAMVREQMKSCWRARVMRTAV